jgi:hypothetical protein
MNRSTIFALLMVSILMSVFSLGIVCGEDDDAVDIWIVVGITDIDQNQKTATLEVYVHVLNYPYNLTQIEVWISGGGYSTISCTNTYAVPASIVPRFGYEGMSNITLWSLQGWSETYPFDSYLISFNVDDITYSQNRTYSLNPNFTYALFRGDKSNILNEQWRLASGMKIPISRIGEKTVVFIINRSSDALWAAVSRFLLPIIACYYLLGATLSFKSGKLIEKLVIYLSLIVFSSVFLISLPNMPYNPSLLEILLSNLIVGSVIFTIVNIISTLKLRDSAKWDLTPAIVSLTILVSVYITTFAAKLDAVACVVMLVVIVPAYFYGYILKTEYGARAKPTSARFWKSATICEKLRT